MMFRRPFHPLQSINNKTSVSSSSSAASNHPSTRTLLISATSSSSSSMHRAYDKNVGLGLSSSLPIRAVAGGEMLSYDEMKKKEAAVATKAKSYHAAVITGLTTAPMKPSSYVIKLFIQTRAFSGIVDTSVSEGELNDHGIQPLLSLVQVAEFAIGKHSSITSQVLQFYYQLHSQWAEIQSKSDLVRALRINGLNAITCLRVIDASDVTTINPMLEGREMYTHVHAGVKFHGSVSPRPVLQPDAPVFHDDSEETEEKKDDIHSLVSLSASTSTSTSDRSLAHRSIRRRFSLIDSSCSVNQCSTSKPEECTHSCMKEASMEEEEKLSAKDTSKVKILSPISSNNSVCFSDIEEGEFIVSALVSGVQMKEDTTKPKRINTNIIESSQQSECTSCSSPSLTRVRATSFSSGASFFADADNDEDDIDEINSPSESREEEEWIEV